jgi:hypothetical protein
MPIFIVWFATGAAPKWETYLDLALILGFDGSSMPFRTYLLFATCDLLFAICYLPSVLRGLRMKKSIHSMT